MLPYAFFLISVLRHAPLGLLLQNALRGSS